MTAGSGRCYIDDEGAVWAINGTSCPEPAKYLARLTWTNGPMCLCETHAQTEREHGDVLEIRSITPPRGRHEMPTLPN